MTTVGIGVRGRVVQIVGNAVLLIGVFLTIMPFFYMVSASFKPGSELYSIPVKVLPENLYLGNYQLLYDETSFVRWFANSVFVALARTIIAITLSLMAGYAFAKFEFRFKRPLFILVIATLTLPLYVILGPLFSMMTRLRWTDSYWALILPFTAQAIGIFLARQQLLGIPNERLGHLHAHHRAPRSARDRRDGNPLFHGVVERLHLAADRPDERREVHRQPRIALVDRPLQPGIRRGNGGLVPGNAA